MVCVNDFVRYVDYFGTTVHFFTDKQPKLYTFTGGILTLLTIFFSVIIFLLQSVDDFRRTNPITSTSYIYKEPPKIKFGEKHLWIPWRIVDYNRQQYINHTEKLYPIITYYYGEKVNNSLNFKMKYIKYKLCNETKMINSTDKFIMPIPLNEIYCIDMDDLEVGGSWTANFISYIDFSLYVCKDGIDYNENNKNCTSYEEIKNLTEINNSLEMEFFFPEVGFQPTNLSNPIIVFYEEYFYHLSKFSSKIDRLYLQETILDDDFGWIIAKNKKYSLWGMSKIDSEAHFIGSSKDIMSEGSTSRLYSINFYLESTIIYNKRYFKKIQEILSESIPIIYLIYTIFKNIARTLKKAEKTKKMIELLFEKIYESSKRENKSLSPIKKNEKNSFSNSKMALNNIGHQLLNNNFFQEVNNLPNDYNEDKQSKGDKSKSNYACEIDNVHNNNEINGSNAQKTLKKQEKIPYFRHSIRRKVRIFPYRYYLFSTFIKTMDISKFHHTCFSRRFIKVYKFISQLFDISSYLVLQREFNVLKNYIFKGNDLHIIEQDKKIDVNDHSFMKNINNCIDRRKLDIFSKNNNKKTK